jgi:lysophospholipase L1-like esterase
MKIRLLLACLNLSLCGQILAEPTIPKPNNDPYFDGLYLVQAPQPKGPVLRPGDRLAICGDSITEQRMYSRIMETYLTVALPELNISTRQYGWSGEQASGFLHRMTNDVLRFDPNVATTCYGMNDHRYRPYEPAIGQAYASNMTDIVEAFNAGGTRVIAGAPGCMGMQNPPWNFIQGTPKDRNISLCALRDIDIEIAQAEHAGFADVFWDMYLAQYSALHRYGSNYTLAGKDSVHPGWAGHLVMAYAFLKALDVPGDIGTFTVNLGTDKATVSKGHELISYHGGDLTVRSSRYPFCATGEADKADSIRSGMSLVPFNADLNRLMLVVKGAKAKNYQITWGATSRTYAAQQLAGGVNLAADFEANPFSGAFKAVDEAVGRKQDFETTQIKKLFHGEAGKADMEKTVTDSERDRAPLVAAIKEAFVPVTHTLTIRPQ